MSALTRIIRTDGKRTECTKCKTLLDAAESSEDTYPKPGDISICKECGHIAEYLEDLTIGDIPVSRWNAMDEDDIAYLLEIQEHIRMSKN